MYPTPTPKKNAQVRYKNDEKAGVWSVMMALKMNYFKEIIKTRYNNYHSFQWVYAS